MADIINIYTLIETTNKAMERFLYNYYIVSIKDNHAYFNRVAIEDGIKIYNDVKTSTVVGVDNDNTLLRILTRNSVYTLQFECTLMASEINACSDMYSHFNGGGCMKYGNPYTLRDKGYIYNFGDYTLEFRYLTHPDVDGKDIYYDFPENIWIAKDGENIWSVDSPTMRDLIELVRLALTHTISTDTLYNLTQSEVYVYKLDAYLHRQ